MGKIKDKLKEVDFWLAFVQRVVSLLLVVIPAVFWIIGAIDKRIDDKLEPINSYFITQTVFEVDKQFYKIRNTPEDVKPIDIEWTIKIYDGMNDQYKTMLLEEKIAVIRRYAMENIK